MALKIKFLGAAGTVTGSKFLIETDGAKILIDCGLFQGFKQLRLRNWADIPIDPKTLDAVILTHAHIDHSGYVPALIKAGYEGPIHCTAGTTDLCKILLPDSGYLQEKHAEHANRYKHTRHHPAKPLYGLKDAQDSLSQFQSHPFDKRIHIVDDIYMTFHVAGHILGAAIVELAINGKSIVFTGDLGRPHDPLMKPPAVIEKADYLVLESTYGDRQHGNLDPQIALAEVINRTIKRFGTIIIPSFAVGRTQALLYHLSQLQAAEKIFDVPIYLDSPMAVDATQLFCRHSADHKLPSSLCRDIFSIAEYVNGVEESKALTSDRTPKIIISASGMATGGRVIHHLKKYVIDESNTVIFAGFQAGGTRGEKLVNGANEIKIHGHYYPVRAEIVQLDMLSAHADASEILDWLRPFKRPPQKTFIVHGEPKASDALRLKIQETYDWSCLVPEHNSVHLLK